MIKVHDKEIPWREGMTVSDVLAAIGDPYPYAVVKVNQKTVSRPDFDRMEVPDGADIFPITMVAGG